MASPFGRVPRRRYLHSTPQPAPWNVGPRFRPRRFVRPSRLDSVVVFELAAIRAQQPDCVGGRPAGSSPFGHVPHRVPAQVPMGQFGRHRRLRATVRQIRASARRVF